MLENACGNRVNYVSAGKNSAHSAGLEPNHTQFLLVDQAHAAAEDPTFGSEFQLLEDLQAELHRVYGAPTVLLVIQGGPGTLDTMLRAQRQGIVTVLAADSGKVASAVAHYMRTGEVSAEYAGLKAKFEEIKRINAVRAQDDDLEGQFDDHWPLVSLFFLRGKDHIGEAVLNAVLRQSTLESRTRHETPIARPSSPIHIVA